MPKLLAPGVYRERDDRLSRALPVIRTDICGFVGLAERGPLQRAVACDSWERFETTFGTFLAGGYLAYAAKAFFENGGRTLVAVRVAVPAAEATSFGPQPADGTSSVLDTVDGFAAGAIVTIRQEPVADTAGAQPPDRQSSAVTTIEGFTQGTLALVEQALPAPVRALRRVVAVESQPSPVLWWDEPLDASFDLTSPIHLTAFRREDRRANAADRVASSVDWDVPITGFALGAGAPALTFVTGADAAEVVLFDAHARPTVRIRANSPGVWGNRLAVRVTRTARSAAVARKNEQPPGGAASNVSSIAGLAVGALTRLFQPGAMGEAFRRVEAIDPITARVTWDAPLDATYDPTVDLSMETVEVGIAVLLDGRIREVHDGLSLDERHPRYVVAALADSRHVSAEDLGSPSAYDRALPDPRSRALERGFGILRGGRDGLAALRPVDLTGDPLDADKRGVRLFEDEPDVSQIAVPDVCIVPVAERTFLPPPPPEIDECLPYEPLPPVAVPPPVLAEQPPEFDVEAIFFVHEQLVEHCRLMGDRVALLDTPFALGVEPASFGEVEAWRARFDSAFAALFFPWLVVVDPLRGAVDPIRPVPPSAHVAGIIARVDRTIGVHKAPGNEEARWAQALALPVEHEDQEELHPRGVNCFRALPGRRIRLYGSSTMSSDASWRDLNVRRLMNMIKRAVRVGTEWSAFEPNDALLGERIRFAIVGLFESLWERGALVGDTREDAFFVRSITQPTDADEGRALFEAGFAPARPAEFVVVRVGRTDDELRVTEEV